MRGYWTLVLTLTAAPLWAQNQAPLPRRQELMSQITERFMENYREEAGLTADQYQKFRTIAQRSFEQRRDRQQKEQGLWRALEGQMRPGMAANPDSVTKLLDAIIAVRALAVDQIRADQKEYAGFLTPVQRAQLFLAIERLQRNVEDLIRRRMERGGPGGLRPNLPEEGPGGVPGGGRGGGGMPPDVPPTRLSVPR